MKLSNLQFYSLIWVMCAMIVGMMGMAFVLPTEPVKESTEPVEETTISVDKSAVTVEESTEPAETAVIEEAETIQLVETVTESVQVTESWSDRELMARCVWAEARGESYAGQVAVAEVILNRVKHHDFPDSVYDVIYERGQFACLPYLGQATPTAEQYQAVDDALNGNGVLNNQYCTYFSVGSCCGSYYTTIGNHVFGCEF